MCGPSHEQRMLEAKQSSLADLMMQSFRQRFAQQSDLLTKLQQSVYQPIISAGPGQQGMTPQERAAYQTQILNTTGANYESAKRALQTTLSARGGGNVALPSGAEAQLQAVLASQAAGQTSAEELALTQQDYALGRERYDRAVAGQQALLGAFDPTAYASRAESGFGTAFGEATKIKEMENQAQAAITGGAFSLGMDALTFGAGAMGGGGFSGGVRALKGGGV